MGKQGKNNKHSPKPKNKTATTTASNEKQEQRKGPPFGISLAEYQDLVQQVAYLTIDEIQEEWILAARYGDLDVLHAILASSHFSNSDTVVVNAQDPQNGNTALHMAAANGHANVVDFLLDHRAQHAIVNHAGNTPLHWAAANGHEAVVAVLLQRVSTIDVLVQNQFGRSALTEGFSSQNTNLVKLLLEHDSAAEERLVQGTGNSIVKIENDENADDENAHTNNNEAKPKTTNSIIPMEPKKNELIHDFDFRIPSADPACPEHHTADTSTTNTNLPLRVRELPIPISHDPFGDRPELDTTGYGIWAASLVMARWMADSASRFHGKRLLELGAGCGVPGLSAAFYSDATDVYLTDVNPTTIANLQYNIELNKQQQQDKSGTPAWEQRLHAGPINWEDPTTWPNDKIDIVIGSDLIYQSSIVPILKQVVLGLCHGQGTFLYVAPDIESDIGRDGLEEFIQAMKATEGCELVSDKIAPKEYHANPLSNQDDDLCFLHFHELSSAAYRLFEFKINMSPSL